MTRSVGTPLVSYSGSGSSGPFSFPHYVSDSSLVTVTKISSAGTRTTLVEGTDYTFSGEGSAACSVTTTDTVDTGETLTIYRSTPIEQSQSVIQGGSFSSTTQMNMADRAVDMIQELAAKIANFLLPLGGYGPTHATNAGKYLKISSDGSEVETADSVDVDTFTPGINCLVVATSNITLSGTQTIDGVGVVATNTVLVTGQTDKSENGVYVVAAGAWTRHTDHDTSDELQAMTAFGVTSGTQYAGTIWVQLVKDPVIGTDDIVIAQWPGSASYTNVSVANGGTLNFGSSDVIAQHSSNLVAWSGGQTSMTYNGGATSEPLRLVNSTDAASVEVLSLEGDRATMADNDEAYISLKVSNDAGTQTEIARLTWVATDVNNATSEDGQIDFGVMTAGSLADKLQLTGTALAPSANDGLALGTTALGFADLYMASGAIIDFGNNEMRITSAANSLAVTGGSLSVTDGTAASTPAFTATNTTDNATVAAARFAGDRATPANADTGYLALDLSNGSGTQKEYGRISWHADDVTNASEDGHLRFWAMTAGALNAELKLDGAALSPVTNDGLALGTASLAYSDAFFASDAVLNFGAGDVTITHSANTMTFAGASSGYAFDANLLLASGSAINWNSGDVTLTHSANTLAHAGASSGYTFDAIVAPASNDGAPLGSTTANWSDLFLASGSVVNWNNSEMMLTHSTDTLTYAGAAIISDRQNVADNSYHFGLQDTGTVAHGMTANLPTAMYFAINKHSTTGGGARITGAAEDGTAPALAFFGLGDATTTKSTLAQGVFEFNAFENDGTSNPASLSANANIAVFRAGTTTRFILDADGESHQDVGTSWLNYDFVDDIQTLNALAYHVSSASDPIKEKFNEWTLAKRESLEAMKLVNFGEDGRPFMNMSKLAMLHTGAIRQLGEQLAEREARIAALERRLMAIEAK